MDNSNPSSSKVLEEYSMVAALLDVLGVGMADPNAVFQALTSEEMVIIEQPDVGKNPKAGRKGRNAKFR